MEVCTPESNADTPLGADATRATETAENRLAVIPTETEKTNHAKRQAPLATTRMIQTK